jgi:antitoxin VapB
MMGDMALNINHPDADRLARELASNTGETVTEAVLNSLRERLDRERRRRSAAPSAKDLLREVRERLARCSVRDSRPADEILGYDDQGLPH